jgi:hypothetical protein
MPPSRAKAKHMRLMLVIERPGSHIATTMITAMRSPSGGRLAYTGRGPPAGSMVAAMRDAG